MVTHKAIKSVFWVSGSFLITKILRFSTTLILAKLLLPSDFGLLAIGLLVINSIIIFRDLGLGHAIVQRQKDIEEAADTAFILNQVSAFMLFILANLFAPFLANFFKNPAVEPVIRLLSLTLLIDALAIIPSFLLDKQLAFGKKFLPEIISTSGYCIAALLLAYLKFGVWSIVYAQIISSIILTYSIWKTSGWKLRLKFNRSLGIEIFSYGKYIICMNLLAFAITNVDNAFIGRLTDIKNLGFYAFAMMIANIPSINISHIVGRIMFPLYSQIQDDKELLSKTYLKTIKYISFFVIPVSFGILFFCPDLIRIFYAQKWTPAILPLKILIFYGIFRAFGNPLANLLMATGGVRLLSILELSELGLGILLLYPVINNYGIAGASALMTILTMSVFILLTIIIGGYLKISFHYYLRTILPHIIIFMACGSVAYSLSKLIYPAPNLILVISAVLLTGVSYLFLNFLYDKELKYFFLSLKQRLLSA